MNGLSWSAALLLVGAVALFVAGSFIGGWTALGLAVVGHGAVALAAWVSALVVLMARQEVHAVPGADLSVALVAGLGAVALALFVDLSFAWRAVLLVSGLVALLAIGLLAVRLRSAH